jgi:hypothetical protein
MFECFNKRRKSRLGFFIRSISDVSLSFQACLEHCIFSDPAHMGPLIPRIYSHTALASHDRLACHVHVDALQLATCPQVEGKHHKKMQTFEGRRPTPPPSTKSGLKAHYFRHLLYESTFFES